MGSIFSFSIILTLLLPIASLGANQNNTITWLINDAKPYYINNGKLKGEGFGDLTQKMIIQALPQYKHFIKKSPLSRVMKDFEYKKNICFSTWIYNSTPDLTLTSIPNIYYMPLGIITSKKNQKLLGKAPISLTKTIQDHTLIFAQAKGRGYGEPLESIIAPYKQADHFKIRSSSKNSHLAILEMIERGRVDYTIDYPHTIQFYKQLNNSDELVFYLSKRILIKEFLAQLLVQKILGEKKLLKISIPLYIA